MFEEKRILAITAKKIIDTGLLDDSFVLASNAPLDGFFSTCNNYGYLRVTQQKNGLFLNLDLYVWKNQPKLTVSVKKTDQELERIIEDLPDCRLLVHNDIFELFIETCKELPNIIFVPHDYAGELQTSY